jgi:hypothetical protein
MTIKRLVVPVNSEYIVIVFDLCSSSTILEDLQEQGRLSIWKKFWEEVYAYLEKMSISSDKYMIYKFVGDGFVLLYKTQYESSLLLFCKRLSEFINRKINEIVEKYMNTQPERIGITIGIDKGKLIKLTINKEDEYTGKAINVAARLQSSLKRPENANKVLITKAIRNIIIEKYDKIIYKEVQRALANLFGDKPVYCYEIDLAESISQYLLK